MILLNMDLIIIIFIILLPFLYYISPKFLFQKPKNLPPGSTGWPLIGETMELGMFGAKGIPEKIFQNRMIKYSQQVFKTSLIGEKAAVLCGISGNKFLFSNEGKIVSIFWPRTIKKFLPHMENKANVAEETNKVRNILTDFLKPEFLQNCVGNVDAVARKHFDTKWGNFNKEVKAFPLAKDYAFSVACKMFLSIDDPKSIEGMAKPFHVLAAGLFGIPFNLPGMAYNKGIKASNLIREKLFEVIKERKAHIMAGKSPWSHDILWNMIMVPDAEGRFLSELEMADNILVCFFASQDSTSATVAFLVKYLAEFHEIYEEVLKEQRSILEDMKECDELSWKDLQKMKYSWNVANEVMRLMPPFQGGFREALTDFTYSGFFIPKGWKLYWTPHTTHMNPEYFPEPEKFDPSRYEGTGPLPYSHVPFGGGSRICPGREVARIIILVFVHNLVKRFRWEKVIPNEKIIVQPVPTPSMGLPIRLHPH